MQHESHSDVLKRLKRAGGHLHSVCTMIENQRSCTDIAQQLHAVEKAVKRAKEVLIHDHIDHCLETAIDNTGDVKAALKEFKEISKYL